MPFGRAVKAFEAGDIKAHGRSTLPVGWLWCDGAAVSRTTYAALFAAIGTAFGAGDGATTFNLPDLRGRVPAGKDDMGGTAANRLTSGGSGIAGNTLGAAGGTQTHTLSIAQLPAHTHAQASNTMLSSGGGGFGLNLGNTATGGTTAASGSGSAHQNTQPTQIVNYIIKS